MIPIQAKQILSSVKQPDTFFGLKYNMNLYRGCQHGCIYCDSRSECYGIENFEQIQYKANALGLLEKELSKKRVIGTIGFGSMHDPYMPIEEDLQLTRKALEIILKYKFPIHIITKSTLILRDLDLIKKISKVYAAITFTITTTDDELAAKLEPNAASPSERLKALRTLSKTGIYTGITLMPVLPMIEDSNGNIGDIISKGKENGAQYIIPCFGVTLRDRQRLYYYEKLDKLFPGMKEKYQNQFGNKYFCPDNKIDELSNYFYTQMNKQGLSWKITPYKIKENQNQLFQ